MGGRTLPIDPDTALGIWCAPGETVTIPAVLRGRRSVRVTDAGGIPRPFVIDGRQAAGAAEVEAGAHILAVTGDAAVSRFLLISAERPELSPEGPPPPVPEAERAAVPKFAPLLAGATAFFDLGRSGSRPFALRVAEAGFYRVETTGRLATSLTLSDRFRQFQRSASANGVGRNALLIEYLVNSRGGRLSRQSAWTILRTAAERAGITADVSPHTLRPRHATPPQEGGADVRDVQELLGHASVTTTEIYTMVTVDHLREVYRSAHPRAMG
jgi:hypothetical protein